MSELEAVSRRMQQDWNERAREDAHFYVAFGRKEQDNEEFFATAAEVVKGLEHELRRLPRARRALEIGCGPGRLMKPMSRRFAEIHGVDVSDEMIERAKANLRDVPHAHPHHTSGADLAQFPDEYFDFVYSYAVFQHIPSRDVVMQYLREAYRVMKANSLMRVQINGLDRSAKEYDTWSGVRISADEVREFAREHGLQLMALEGVRTQYMWATFRKRETRIRRVTNAHSSEPAAPPSGRFASITLWVESLPEWADLNSLSVTVDSELGTPVYIGPAEHDGLQQINVLLPELKRTGIVPLELSLNGRRLCSGTFRIVPAGPSVPVVLSITDGINIMSGTRIVSGSIKVTIEEHSSPERFAATVDGLPVREIDIFCADPLPPRFEINFKVPEGLAPGEHLLKMSLGKRNLGEILIVTEP